MVESSRTQPIKWTTEGKVKSVSRVFFDVRLTSVVIDVIASTKKHDCIVNQGGTAEYISVLDRKLFSVGTVFYLQRRKLAMYYPTLEQIKEIIKTGDYNLVPVCKEMYGDSITPIEVMQNFKKT